MLIVHTMPTVNKIWFDLENCEHSIAVYGNSGDDVTQVTKITAAYISAASLILAALPIDAIFKLINYSWKSDNMFCIYQGLFCVTISLNYTLLFLLITYAESVLNTKLNNVNAELQIF